MSSSLRNGVLDFGDEILWRKNALLLIPGHRAQIVEARLGMKTEWLHLRSLARASANT